MQVIEGRESVGAQGQGHVGIPICVAAFKDRLASGAKEPGLEIRLWKWT